MSTRRRDHHDLTATVGSLRAELRAHRHEIQRLRVENEILREAAEPLIHHAPARERFAFVHRLRTRFGIRRLCRILVTDHSNYYAWVRAKARRNERAADDQELVARITEIHTAHPAYGAERVTRELKRQGLEAGRHRVARLMRQRSQYHATAYRNALRRLEIRQSTSRTGSCLDGAAAESFFATIKSEIGVTSWPNAT